MMTSSMTLTWLDDFSLAVRPPSERRHIQVSLTATPPMSHTHVLSVIIQDCSVKIAGLAACNASSHGPTNFAPADMSHNTVTIQRDRCARQVSLSQTGHWYMMAYISHTIM